MDEWTESFVTASGIQVHYHRSSSNNKPAILLLHGVTDSGLCWTRVAHDLEDSYAVVMTDARGHGESDRIGEEFSIDLLAEDAAAVIHQLGLDPSFVFGHSMGASTAAVLAARHPELVRALVLEDPALGDALPPPDVGAAQPHALLHLRELPREERLERAFTEQPGWPREEIIPWSDSKVQFDLEILRRGAVFRRVPWRDVLAAIDCPVLLLTADVERGAIITPETAREAASLLKDGEVAHISDAGHCIHRDRYEETMQQVLAFMRTH